MPKRRFPPKQPTHPPPPGIVAAARAHARAKFLVETSVDMLLERMGPYFENPWREAQRRLGPEAGTTLRLFLLKYIKPSTISPWEEAESDTDLPSNSVRVRQHGSSNPLTFDVLICMCDYAQTTRPATITLTDVGQCVEVEDSLVIFRAGEWSYYASPPKPGAGLELKPEEKVVCLATRLTMPFAM